MPVVPDFAIPDVAPDARMASLDPNAGIAAPQALAGLGEQVQKSEDQTSSTLLNLQQMKDQAAVADKINQYQTAANANYQQGGLFTLQGKNAIDAYPQAVQNLENIRSSLIAGASNPYEQEALASSLNDQQAREFRTMGSFYSDQVRQYHDDSLGALADTATQTATLNYNNPDALSTSLATVQHAAMLQAQTRGYNPDMTNQYVLGATSKAASSFIDAAMVNDPGLASTYLTKYKSDLDPATYMELSGRVRQAVLPGAADEVAGAVLGTNASVVPQDVMDQIAQNESGNKPGEISSTGAVGPYQIEPSTGEAAAKEIGVPWDPQRALNDPAYGRQIATRIMDDNLKTFAGMPYQYQAAVAAYNAGPNGAGVAHLAQTGDPSQLPAETQAYLPKFDLSGAAPVPGTAGQSIDQQGQNLQALMQQGGEALAARFPDQPNAYEMGSQAVYSQYIRSKSAYDDQQSAALNAVTNAIDANHVQNVGDLIKLGGDVAQSYLALEPEKQAGVMALIAKNQPGADTSWSPQKQQTYYNLLGQSVTNPSAFQKLNLMDPQVINSLTPDQQTTLMNKQASMAKGSDKGLSPDDINGALSWVAPILKGAGFNPKNKDDPAYQQFAGAYAQDLQAYSDKNGHMPDAVDQQKIAQRLLVQGYSGTGGMFFGPKKESLYQAEGPNGIDPNFSANIPAPALSQINAAYQKATGKLPDIKTATAIYLQNMAPGDDSQQASQ
jgi:hypothetical protein